MSDDATPERKPKPKKSTDAEVALRVDEIYRIRIDGAQFHDVREYSVKMGWNISDSMLRKYIERANKLLRERRERVRATLFSMHLTRVEALYARSVAAADFRTALACLQDAAKANRLYPDDKNLAKQLGELLKRLAELEGADLGKPAITSEERPAEDRATGTEEASGHGE